MPFRKGIPWRGLACDSSGTRSAASSCVELEKRPVIRRRGEGMSKTRFSITWKPFAVVPKNSTFLRRGRLPQCVGEEVLHVKGLHFPAPTSSP